jgi:hypothetical protein
MPALQKIHPSAFHCGILDPRGGSNLNTYDVLQRAGSKARRVQQEIRSKRIHLPDRSGGVIEVTCVIAREVNAPADIKPLEWRLLTNRLANDFESAAELIDWYRARWEIELFFHVFKNGCKVEALQLSSIERLERALSLFMVVA